MINKQFEAYKVKREIKRSGSEYQFKRPETNDFGEPKGTDILIGTLKGIYHDYAAGGSRIEITTDTIQTRTKKKYQILCVWEDAESLELQVGDFTMINGKKYDVTGVANIQEWNIIGEVNLEVVDDGSN